MIGERSDFDVDDARRIVSQQPAEWQERFTRLIVLREVIEVKAGFDVRAIRRKAKGELVTVGAEIEAMLRGLFPELQAAEER